MAMGFPNYHPEALNTFYNTLNQFRDVRDELSEPHKPLNVLDYGSGTFGVGRALLGSILTAQTANVFLYDPHVAVQPARNGYMHVIDDAQLQKLSDIDWVNLSYVMCHLDTEEEAYRTLRTLRESHPKAVITIVDYMLKNREETYALNVLSRSEVEQKERNMMHNDSRFIAMHSRYDVVSLQEMARAAGMNALQTKALDSDETHCLFRAEPLKTVAAAPAFGFGGW